MIGRENRKTSHELIARCIMTTMKNILFGFVYFVLASLFVRPIFAQGTIGTANPVIWKTAYNEFSSSNFYIQIGERTFYGSDAIRVNSDPGIDKTTLELEWKENDITMRFYLYFEKIENGMWQLYDMRTYNATGTDWIYYQPVDSLGNSASSLIGQRNYAYERTFLSQDGSAKIYCKECSITAFISNIAPPSVHGYVIDFRIGIPQNETITITNEPNTGYGVNAVLMDASGSVVKDQSDFTYSWKVENTSTLSIYAQGVPYPDGNCAYGILAPCPDFNVQIRGINPGISRVLLDITRKSDQTVVASNAFTVRVIEKTLSPTPIPSPTVKITPTLVQDDVTAQLTELQGEVGRLTNVVEKQQVEITVLQRIIQTIQEFLKNLF
jgi:hypothetical protein